MENKELNISLSKDVKALEIIEHYARERISLNDCYKMLNERLNEKNINYEITDLREILDEKLENEFNKFNEKLKRKNKRRNN